MADRLTIAYVNAAHLAMEEGDVDAAHSLLLLAIIGLLVKDVEAREVMEKFVPPVTA